MSTPKDTDTPPSGAEQVVDNPAQSRFELDLGAAVAVAYYKVDGDRIALLHTEVPQELSGRGIGSRLAKGVFEALRTRGVGVVAKCPFMASYAARHPEYARMLVG
jgi:predicted GNAT family acetyltransferase